jgi:soluble lytic murein transglycosylase-like protein
MARLTALPMKRILPLALMLVASAALAGGHFSASDVRGAGIKQPGRIVIRNDAYSITAFRFFNNVREALLTLRSTPAMHVTPFGNAVYDSRAPLNAPLPAYLTALMTDAAQAAGVDPRLLVAVARRESAFDSRAVSPVGACGIMQIMPATATYLGISDVFDARQNVFGGARYLRTLLDTFHGDLDLTLAAYNAGPGAVQRYNGVPPFPETRTYVTHVRTAYERALRGPSS